MTSIVSKTTKTPLRKLQSPLRFLLASIQRLEEIANFLLFYASRNLVTKTKVGPYPYRSHLQSLRILSGTSNVLQDSRMTLWRHIRDGALFPSSLLRLLFPTNGCSERWSTNIYSK